MAWIERKVKIYPRRNCIDLAIELVFTVNDKIPGIEHERLNFGFK